MALFNYASREISAKIVYYGPGLSGKTTNIEAIHSMIKDDMKGKLISLPTETDRTLFFDFLPVELGEIKGFKVRFHLYTVPGQVFYNRTRKLVLQGVDGIVFVADSQMNMLESNKESLNNLEENLETYGKNLKDLPFVVQYNKRDIKNIFSEEDLTRKLEIDGIPYFSAIAITGEGVKETLMEISKIVFNNLRQTLLLESELGESSPEDIGELVGEKIEGKFIRQKEDIEEIDVVEELPDEAVSVIDFEEISIDEVSTSPSQEVQKGQDVEIEVDEVGEVEEEEGGLPVEGAEDIDLESQEEASDGIDQSFFNEVEIEEESESADTDEGPSEEVSPEPSISFEGEGITFLRMGQPYVTLNGESVVPAVFVDTGGNEVTIKIKISIQKG